MAFARSTPARCALALFAWLVMSLLVSVAPGRAGAVPAVSVEGAVLPFANTQLAGYSGSQAGPLTAGVWTNPQENTCWACNQGGPTTGAATLYVLGRASDPTLLDDATESVDQAIASRQAPNGSFLGPSGDTQSAGVATMFYGVEFGTTYRLLAPYLSTAKRTRWRQSLAAAADYLINSGDTTWYANGNINLGYTEFLWLAWQATGLPRFHAAYDNSWGFTNSPPRSKFPGCGWITVQAPSRADGSDGSGYFAESGAGGTGYDAEYTMLQLDVVSRLYLFSGDRRALRAANMLINMEMPRVNPTTWMLNTSGGTRHTQLGRWVGFQTSAFAVLGLHAGRSDLTRYVLPQIEQEARWYTQPGQADSAGFRRAFGNSISAVALASAYADSANRAELAPYGLLGTVATPAKLTTPPTVARAATGHRAKPRHHRTRHHRKRRRRTGRRAARR